MPRILLTAALLLALTPHVFSQSPRWTDADVKRLTADRTYQGYLERRQKESETDASAQAELAELCRRGGLEAEARGHFWAAVSLDPTNTRYHQALGRKPRTNGLWLSDDELRDALADLRIATRVNRALAARLTKMAPAVAKGRYSGLADLVKEFDEPLGIPTLERAGVQFGETAQQMIVFKLGLMSHAEVTDSLIRHAVFGLNASVRKHAADQLARRNPTYYVPRLVGWLSDRGDEHGGADMPAQGIGGRHAVVWYALVGGEPVITAVGGTGDLAKAAVELQLARGGSPFQTRVPPREWTERVVAALEEATGQRFGADSERWTKWLAELTDSYLPDSANAPPPTIAALPDAIRNARVRQSFVPTGVDCFAAGTTVRTRRGQVPIEDLKVGDLVLSRDMDEGKTAFQPVVRRITRPPTRQVAVTAGGETIVSTLGHPFRVKGRKWVYARDLKPGDEVKTATGYLKVEKVEARESAVAYSIEVANFNTYFVGAKQLLVHDNTPVYDLELQASEADDR